MTHPQKKKVAVLISGNGSNLQALIDYQRLHADSFEIVTVLSNRPDAYGIERAEKAGIMTIVLDHNDYDSREAFDKMMIGLLDAMEPDLLVLAGFMRILTPEFTQHYAGKMLNIHPSLLPKYPGLNTHQKAIEAGDKEHGLSIHFVTAELDGGPVILQASTEIARDDNAESLQQKVHKLEHLTYPLVVDWFCQDKLCLQDNQVLYQGQTLAAPLTFTDFNIEDDSCENAG